jgi:hypothetical protein
VRELRGRPPLRQRAIPASSDKARVAERGGSGLGIPVETDRVFDEARLGISKHAYADRCQVLDEGLGKNNSAANHGGENQ